MSPYVAQWARAFWVTFLLELPIVYLLVRRVASPPARKIALILVAQLVTHPAVWFIFPELGLSPAMQLLSCELWAFVGEAIFYSLVFTSLSVRRATLAALLANYVSLVAGLYLREWTAAF